MKRTATFAVLLAAGVGATTLAQSPATDKVPPPPPQTQGQLNSMAAKHPAKPEEMKPLSAAAQADPGKPAHKKQAARAAESKPKPAPDAQKPKDR
jgi:hypothetical protein